MDPDEAKDLIMALDYLSGDIGSPRMMIPEIAASVWNQISDEAKILSTWFDLSNVWVDKNHALIINNLGYWFHC
jgi:hypothetical protein